MEGIVTENNNRHKGGKCNLETLDDSKKNRTNRRSNLKSAFQRTAFKQGAERRNGPKVVMNNKENSPNPSCPCGGRPWQKKQEKIS